MSGSGYTLKHLTNLPISQLYKYNKYNTWLFFTPINYCDCLLVSKRSILHANTLCGFVMTVVVPSSYFLGCVLGESVSTT